MRVGDRISYRDVRGYTYDNARITAVHPNGTIDLTYRDEANSLCTPKKIKPLSPGEKLNVFFKD